MNKTRSLFLVLVVLCLFSLISGSVAGSAVFAADSDLYNNIDDAAGASGDEYFINYRDNYEIDTEKISFFKDPGSVMFNMLSNGIFSLELSMAKLTIALFSFSLTANISTMIGSFIEPFIIAIKASIWDTFALFALGICAFWLLLKMAQNRGSQALSGFIAMMAIIVLALAFYTYPVQMLNGVDTFTNEVAKSVMEGPYQAAGNGSGAQMSMEGKASSLSWNLLVHKPWQVVEFGSIEKAKLHEDAILKLSPGGDERKKLVEQLAADEGLFSKSLSHQIGRCTTALILLIFNLVLMLVLIAFSVLIIGYQFLVLVYLMLGVFIFLIALVPSFGIPLIKRWAMRILSIAFTRILVVFFLSVSLVFMDVIYQFTDEYGLLAAMFVILVMIGALWFERHRLINLFMGVRSGDFNVQTPVQAMNRALDQDFNAFQKLNSLRRDVPMRSQDHEADLGHEGSAEEEQRSFSAGRRYIDQADRANRADVSYNNIPEAGTMSELGHDLKHSADTISSASLNMGRYFKRAEEVLQQQYEKSKLRSEELAESKGEEPEYGNFVKRTEAVRTLGAAEFDQRDISSVAHLLQKVEERGGNVEDVIAGENTVYWNKQNTAVRPADLQQARDQAAERDGREPVQFDRSEAEIKPVGIDYFRQNFGEEKGETFYADLIQKYDQSVVDSFTSERQSGEHSDQDRAEGEQHEKLSFAKVQKQVAAQAQIKAADERRAAGEAREQSDSKPMPEPEAIREREGDSEDA